MDPNDAPWTWEYLESYGHKRRWKDEYAQDTQDNANAQSPSLHHHHPTSHLMGSHHPSQATTNL